MFTLVDVQPDVEFKIITLILKKGSVQIYTAFKFESSDKVINFLKEFENPSFDTSYEETDHHLYFTREGAALQLKGFQFDTPVTIPDKMKDYIKRILTY
jgi:hypothetical protein